MLMLSRFLRLIGRISAVLPLVASPLHAQFLPADVGTTVNGYQDDFEGGTLGADWVVRGQDVFSLGDGSLRVSSTSGDPNHLLFERAGYDDSAQEVLARIRITDFGTGDPARAGLGTVVDPFSSQGINLFFRDEPNPGQRHIEFLDDLRAWGTEFPYAWQNDTWYWLRLRHDPNAASLGGVNDVFGKIWLADGSEPEPADWQTVYDYIPTRSPRTGFAGVAAGSLGGTSEFEVDYILIKAAGLPSITVAPEAFVQTPVSITDPPESQSMMEGETAVFTVVAEGNPQPTFQWLRNDAPIPGATESSHTISPVPLGEDGARFKVVAQNVTAGVTNTATSGEAVLTVTADLTPPELVEAHSIGLSQVEVVFSERVTPLTATNAENYAIIFPGGSIPVSGATIDVSRTRVTLDVGELEEGIIYTLIVNNVVDASSAGNGIAPGSTTTFGASSYTQADIGNPQPAGNTVVVPGGIDVTAGGQGIGGSSDSFSLNHQPRTGDFDVRVRVESISLANAWSEAGLVARENESAGARFAGVLATPSIGGTSFRHRTAVGGNVTRAGSFPVNPPNTWLRLRRAGDQFTGFAGYDGQNWTTLGSASITMPQTVLLGFAVASSSDGDTTKAGFRDYSAVSSPGVLSAVPPVERPGPSSRRTGLVISEIMYHPPDRTDGRDLEFVELFNTDITPLDLGGFRLDGDVAFQFPTGTILPAGGIFVVARSPADVEAVHGISGVMGPFSNPESLPNDNGIVRLRNHVGAVMLEVEYLDAPPWPVAADGAGHSLVLARPSQGEGEAGAWAASDAVGGSPGRLDPYTPDPLRNVVINEFLAHTDDPELDFIELHNRGAAEVDLTGSHLSDSRNTLKYTFPDGTLLPPGGFVARDQNELGFALSATGETIYFRNAANTRVIDAVRFGGQETGVSTGRFPDGAGEFYRLTASTPGQPNPGTRVSEVILNELMYHAISGDDDDQYVELHNRSANPVDLSGWELSDGIRFRFPTNTVIPANGYLVVARDAERLRLAYPDLNAANCLGDFDGRLSGSGERVALTKFDTTTVINAEGIEETVEFQITVDEVTYVDGGRWPKWADGRGSSLERIDARANGRLASNWAASDETGKAPWTIIEHRGILDHGTGSADSLQVFLQGDGDCLIDDVEVLDSNGNNRIANSTFEGGAAGWVAEGTQDQSGLETNEGYNSARSYHVHATKRGDTTINRIRTSLTSSLQTGSTATIRAKVRWLRGHPEVLLRVRGNYLEAIGRMTIPSNLGTPGQANSRAASNTGPAIYEVAHAPVLPAANEPVVVTARVEDPDGIAQVLLNHRVDPGTTYASVPMRDDGTGGDAIAGDGIYSATLPGRSSGTLAAFYIQATDDFDPQATRRFPDDAPIRECLVRFGEVQPAGALGTYRVWMTQATFDAWSSRHRLHNTPFDVTFVYNDQRVIYNTEAMFAGSPYISGSYNHPAGNLCGYTVVCPKDDLFLGVTDVVLDWPGRDSTGVQEQAAYWIADRVGLANNHRRFIRLHVNGVTETQRGSIYEDVQQPSSDVMEQWVPDDPDGRLYKIERWFEFSDNGSRIADPMPTLQDFTTTDLATGRTVKKLARYRWNWLPRAVRDTANDYTDLFLLVDAVNASSPEPYTSQTSGLADMEQWMSIFAVEHIVNNFDSYGHNIGKNMYAYKPVNGPWQLHMFDIDWVMLASISAGYNTDASLFDSNDPVIGRMYNHPPFRRAYFRTVRKVVDGPMAPATVNAWLDDKHSALVAEDVTRSAGQTLSSPNTLKNWMQGRRNYLIQQLNTVAASFDITSNNGNDFSSSSDIVTLSGTAPIEVATLRVNGLEHRVTWTSATAWSLRLALLPGQNPISIAGYDPDGQPVSGAADTIGIQFNGTVESPVGWVMINEIHYHPPLGNAEFVEIHNRSATTTFDLSGWRLNGAGFSFPGGTLIDPGEFLVVTRDLGAFLTSFGGAISVSGVFDGALDNGGETLSLIRPGATPAEDEVIDIVSYDDDPPWPVEADGIGPSLQLIDPARDNSRVANWAAGAPATPGAPNSVQATLPQFPPVWLNELQPDNVSGITDHAGEQDPWVEIYNAGTVTVSLDGWHLTDDYSDLTKWAFPSGTSIGPSEFRIVWLDGQPAQSTGIELHTSFRIPSDEGSVALVFPLDDEPTVLDFINYQSVGPDRSTGFFPDGESGPRQTLLIPTPGQANDNSALPLTVFINEWMAANSGAVADPSDGNFDDWFELYNPNGVPVDLGGYSLTDNLTGGRWTIPDGTVIPARGFLLVWADDEVEQNTPGSGDLHAPFRLSRDGEAIGLFAPNGTLVDAVTFGAQTDNISQGRWPDGEDAFHFMEIPTPGAANVIPGGEIRILSASIEPDGDLTISWSARAGQSYRVQFKNHLADTSWTNLDEVDATDMTASLTVGTDESPHRFYRILQETP